MSTSTTLARRAYSPAVNASSGFATSIRRCWTRVRSSRDGLAVPISKCRYTATESQLTISPENRSASEIASADLPEPVGPRTTTRSGSGGVDDSVAIHRAPQGMVFPKRTNAMSRMSSASMSKPVSFTRSRDFCRSYHSGVRGCCSRAAGGSLATAPFYALAYCCMSPLAGL